MFLQLLYLVESGGVKDEPQRPDVSNEFRVNPELKEEYKLGVDKELGRGDDQSSRKVKPMGQLKEALEIDLVCEIKMLNDTWKTGCLKAVVRLNSSLL